MPSPGERCAVRVRRLAATAPEAVLRRLDAILLEARSALVRSNEHLALAAERLADAAGERDRILLYARLPAEKRTVGLLDAALHHPEPGDLTVAVLAVAARSRRRGVGLALVLAAIERAARRGRVDRVLAAVHARATTAADFWARLGLEEIERSGGVALLGARVDKVRAAVGQ